MMELQKRILELLRKHWLINRDEWIDSAYIRHRATQAGFTERNATGALFQLAKIGKLDVQISENAKYIYLPSVAEVAEHIDTLTNQKL